MTKEEIKEATEEITSYFKDCGVILTDFDLQECADAFEIPIKNM